MLQKYIYKNDSTVVNWSIELASELELINRDLPENERHVIGFDTENPNEYKWSSGRVIQKTFEERALQGLISRNDLEEIVKQKIYNYFEIVTKNGVLHNGSWYEADETSCNRVTNAIKLLEVAGSGHVHWVDKSNVSHDMDLQALYSLGLAMGGCFQTAFDKRTELRDELSSKTIQQLLDYDIEYEWSA